MASVSKMCVECSEYEIIYDSEYGEVYDQNFVFYDEENFDDEVYHDYNSDDDQDDDLVLDEIPFVYCPSKGEFAEA